MIMLRFLNLQLTIMKKYSSYVDLKIPTTSRMSSSQYWPQKMMIGIDNIGNDQITTIYRLKQSIIIPTTTKYSGGYLQRKKIQQFKKQNKDILTKYNKYYHPHKQSNFIKYISNHDKKNKQNIQNNSKITPISNCYQNIYIENKQDQINVKYCKFNSNHYQSIQNHQNNKQSKSKIKSQQKQKISKSGFASNWNDYKQLKQNKQNQQYITKYAAQPKLPHSTSQLTLLKQQNYNQKKPLKGYYKSALYHAYFTTTSSTFNQICKNHLITSIDFLTYIKNHQQIIPNNFIKIYLPLTNKKTIIFDLDQTLIHCNQNLDIPSDVTLDISFPSGKAKVGINIRPYALQCLRQLSKYFQIMILTASHQCYANVVIDYLDPFQQFISYRFFRQTCYKTQQGFYVKDLRVFGRDLTNVLLVDNAAYSYCFQPQNGVPIIPFYNNKADIQLKEITGYLKQFIDVKNIRNKNKNYMKLNQYYRFRCPKKLINQLYF